MRVLCWAAVLVAALVCAATPSADAFPYANGAPSVPAPPALNFDMSTPMGSGNAVKTVYEPFYRVHWTLWNYGSSASLAMLRNYEDGAPVMQQFSLQIMTPKDLVVWPQVTGAVSVAYSTQIDIVNVRGEILHGSVLSGITNIVAHAYSSDGQTLYVATDDGTDSVVYAFPWGVGDVYDVAQKAENTVDYASTGNEVVAMVVTPSDEVYVSGGQGPNTFLHRLSADTLTFAEDYTVADNQLVTMMTYIGTSLYIYDASDSQIKVVNGPGSFTPIVGSQTAQSMVRVTIRPERAHYAEPQDYFVLLDGNTLKHYYAVTDDCYMHSDLSSSVACDAQPHCQWCGSTGRCSLSSPAVLCPNDGMLVGMATGGARPSDVVTTPFGSSEVHLFSGNVGFYDETQTTSSYTPAVSDGDVLCVDMSRDMSVIMSSETGQSAMATFSLVYENGQNVDTTDSSMSDAGEATDCAMTTDGMHLFGARGATLYHFMQQGDTYFHDPAPDSVNTGLPITDIAVLGFCTNPAICGWDTDVVLLQDDFSNNAKLLILRSDGSSSVLLDQTELTVSTLLEVEVGPDGKIWFGNGFNLERMEADGTAREMMFSASDTIAAIFFRTDEDTVTIMSGSASVAIITLSITPESNQCVTASSQATCEAAPGCHWCDHAVEDSQRCLSGTAACTATLSTVRSDGGMVNKGTFSGASGMVALPVRGGDQTRAILHSASNMIRAYFDGGTTGTAGSVQGTIKSVTYHPYKDGWILYGVEDASTGRFYEMAVSRMNVGSTYTEIFENGPNIPTSLAVVQGVLVFTDGTTQLRQATYDASWSVSSYGPAHANIPLGVVAYGTRHITWYFDGATYYFEHRDESGVRSTHTCSAQPQDVVAGSDGYIYWTDASKILRNGVADPDNFGTEEIVFDGFTLSSAYGGTDPMYLAMSSRDSRLLALDTQDGIREWFLESDCASQNALECLTYPGCHYCGNMDRCVADSEVCVGDGMPISQEDATIGYKATSAVLDAAGVSWVTSFAFSNHRLSFFSFYQSAEVVVLQNPATGEIVQTRVWPLQPNTIAGLTEAGHIHLYTVGSLGGWGENIQTALALGSVTSFAFTSSASQVFMCSSTSVHIIDLDANQQYKLGGTGSVSTAGALTAKFVEVSDTDDRFFVIADTELQSSPISSPSLTMLAGSAVNTPTDMRLAPTGELFVVDNFVGNLYAFDRNDGTRRTVLYHLNMQAVAFYADMDSMVIHTTASGAAQWFTLPNACSSVSTGEQSTCDATPGCKFCDATGTCTSLSELCPAHLTCTTSLDCPSNFYCTGSQCRAELHSSTDGLCDEFADACDNLHYCDGEVCADDVDENGGCGGEDTCAAGYVCVGLVCVESAATPTPSPTPTPTAGAALGDPHFEGLHGGWFDFMGRPGVAYHLISTPTLQVNARFGWVDEGVPGTYMDTLALRLGNVTRVTFPRSGDVTIEPAKRHVGGNVYALVGGGYAVTAGDALTLYYDAWTFEIRKFWGRRRDGSHVRTETAAHVGYRVALDEARLAREGRLDSFTAHGVHGQTVNAQAVVASRGLHGEGVIEGVPNDYVVRGGDLFTGTSHYSLFDEHAPAPVTPPPVQVRARVAVEPVFASAW